MTSRRLLLQACPLLWACIFFLTSCSTANISTTTTRDHDSSPVELDALFESTTEDTGRLLVNLAQKQLGQPYRYGGRSPSGFDCSGLVFYLHKQIGLDVPRTSRSQYRVASKVKLEELSPGDLLFFRVSGKKISHVGVYVAGDLFIHSPSSGKGVSYASLDENFWQETLAGAGRLY